MINEYQCEKCGEIWYGDNPQYGLTLDGITLCKDCADEEDIAEAMEIYFPKYERN